MVLKAGMRQLNSNKIDAANNCGVDFVII
jgi:hypothetical protein